MRNLRAKGGRRKNGLIGGGKKWVDLEQWVMGLGVRGFF